MALFNRFNSILIVFPVIFLQKTDYCGFFAIYSAIILVLHDIIEKEFKPDLTIVAAGSAQFDLGDLLLMNPNDVLKFIQNSPNKVYANHMEAVNHCPTTREKLRNSLKTNQLSDKVFIPEDGEAFEMD
mgnify:CR=1 FL=1|tara:strand:- start:2291 stop:2674 length:384 start_codon:yes stop_codon:yes gene_type:complete